MIDCLVPGDYDMSIMEGDDSLLIDSIEFELEDMLVTSPATTSMLRSSIAASSSSSLSIVAPNSDHRHLHNNAIADDDGDDDDDDEGLEDEAGELDELEIEVECNEEVDVETVTPTTSNSSGSNAIATTSALERPALLWKPVVLNPMMPEPFAISGYASFIHRDAVWVLGGSNDQHQASGELLRFDIAEATSTSVSLRWSKPVVVGAAPRRAAFATAIVLVVPQGATQGRPMSGIAGITSAAASVKIPAAFIFGGRDGAVTLFSLSCLSLIGTARSCEAKPTCECHSRSAARSS